jgi:hypothetical protein
MVPHEGALLTNRTGWRKSRRDAKVAVGSRSGESKGEKYMSRIKTILLASVAAIALGAVGASAASAGTGTVTLAGGNPCNITFTSTGGPPAPPLTGSTTITNVNEDTSDPDCAVDIRNPATNITVDFNGEVVPPSTLEANGTISVNLGFTCNYSVVAVGGTYNYSAGTAQISGSLTSGFPCPTPVTGTIDVISW